MENPKSAFDFDEIQQLTSPEKVESSEASVIKAQLEPEILNESFEPVDAPSWSVRKKEPALYSSQANPITSKKPVHSNVAFENNFRRSTGYEGEEKIPGLFEPKTSHVKVKIPKKYLPWISPDHKESIIKVFSFYHDGDKEDTPPNRSKLLFLRGI